MATTLEVLFSIYVKIKSSGDAKELMNHLDMFYEVIHKNQLSRIFDFSTCKCTDVVFSIPFYGNPIYFYSYLGSVESEAERGVLIKEHEGVSNIVNKGLTFEILEKEFFPLEYLLESVECVFRRCEAVLGHHGPKQCSC